jgi:hypothetical protein
MLVSVGQAKADKTTGKLLVRARPVECEIFIDGQHMGDTSWDGLLKVPQIAPGQHTVSVYNWGFVPQTFKLDFTAGKTTQLDVRLEAIPGDVAGPFGRIQIKGAPRAAVLMNGKTPEYVVGHADETDNSFIWQQELLVPPGTHQLTLVHGDKTVWSGPVTVEAGKRTVLDAKTGATKTEAWKGAEPRGDLPRFKAGINTTTIAVGVTKARITASPTEINCGDSSQLSWSSEEAVHTDISGVGDVAGTGSQQVTPKATTTYTLTAGGPGGVVTPTATVTVNSAINGSLEVTPPEITYERVGTQVKKQGTATVTWSATGGGTITVTVDPFGSVDASGSRQVQPVPQRTGQGPVDETITYTLHATNQCGGDVTRTATLHLTGSIKAAELIEEFSQVALVSLYFPTAYPTQQHPEGGLLKSQQEELNTLASAFKTYMGHDPNARLLLEAHADVRGSGNFNKALTERRAARVKEYLVSQGISASAIDTTAVGKENQLGKDEVSQLEGKNPQAAPKTRANKSAATVTWMAYNRRVDVVLQPLGMHSTRYYPHAAGDSGVLWQKPKPGWKVVEKNQ